MPPASHPGPNPANQPPQRRGGAGRAIFLTLVILLLLGSLGFNLLIVGAMVLSGGSHDRIITTTVEDGNADQEVAVIPLTGEIDDETARRIDRFLNHIDEDKEVKAVVLEIDSPGGTVTAADEIYKRVRRFKDERAARGLPNHVVVSMKSMATSGGYYAACAGDYVFAEPTTLTGNIGVLLPRYNVSGLMQKYGVEETTIVSSGAKYKNAGSPFKPEAEQDTRYLQALADHAFTRFKTVVTEGRGAKLVGKKEDLFNGRVFVAGEAKDAGLVDDIGYPHDAYAYAARLASLSKPTVVRYEEPNPSLLGLLTHGQVPSRQTTGKTGAVSANGIEIGAGPEALDSLRTHRLLYR
jgi:protease-4